MKRCGSGAMASVCVVVMTTAAAAIAMGVGSLLPAAGAAALAPAAMLAPPRSAPVAVIAPPNDGDKRFGQAVAACADELVVTAPTDGDDALEPGRVAFVRVGVGAANEVIPQEIAAFSARGTGDHFGCSAAIARWLQAGSINGLAVAAVGADRAGDGPDGSTGSASGAVELYERVVDARGPTAWSWTATVAAPVADGSAVLANAESFGQAVDLARDAPVLAVGAPRADCAGAIDCGAVHVFMREPAAGAPAAASWRHAQEIVAPSLETSAWFGCAVAVSREWLAVGAMGEDVVEDVVEDGGESRSDGATRDAGAVHLYRRASSADGVAYAYVRSLRAPDAGLKSAPFAYFGASLALDGNLLAVGAPRARSADGGVICGAAWVFDLAQPADAMPRVVRSPVREMGAAFGQALALRAGKLVVGAPGVDAWLDAGARAEDAGAAFEFDLTGTSDAACLAQLAGPSPIASALFASSCAIVEYAGHGLRAPRTLAATGHLYIEEESLAPSAGVALHDLRGAARLTAAADTTWPASPSTAPPSRSR